MGAIIKQRREQMGLSQEALASMAGTGQSTIDRIERNDFKRMPSALPKIATILGLNLNELDPSLGVAGERRSTLFEPLTFGPRDLPVYAAAEAGEGAIMVTFEAVEYVLRPAPLSSVKGGYGMLVTGESMVPRYRAGDVVLVNPHLPPRRDDGVLLYAGALDGTVKATLKEFVRSKEKAWVVRRYHPNEQEIELRKSEWPVCHVVVGVYTRR